MIRRHWLFVVAAIVGLCPAGLAPPASGEAAGLAPPASREAVSSGERAVHLYVAPDGRDTWPGTAGRPFATIHRAQQAVRTYNDRMHSDVFVNLRAGTYVLDRPLELSASAGDSGGRGHTVVYQPQGFGTATQDRVVISGGRTISGWRRDSEDLGLWTARAEDLQTRQLYVNGRRAERARLSAGIPGRVKMTDTGYVTDAASPQAWRHPEDIEFVYRNAWPWTESRCGVADISGDPSSTTITMDQPCFRRARSLASLPLAGSSGVLPMPVIAENSISFLIDAGSFYLDRSAPGRHVLWYRSRPGRDLRHATVVVPQVETLVRGTGTEEAPLRGVTLRGLTFAYATWLDPSKPAGFPHHFASEYEAQNPPPGEPHSEIRALVPAAVVFRNVRRVHLEGNKFTHLGAQGLEISGHSANNLVRGNVFTDLSAGAILMGSNRPGAGLTRGSRIANNRIHRIGAEYRGSVGVYLLSTRAIAVAHNQVDHVPSSGIVLNTDFPESPMRSHRVVGNRIFRTLQVVDDGGGIYVRGRQGSSWASGAVIRGNAIHGGPTRPVFNTIGIYTDGGAEWLKVKRNVVYGYEHAIGGCAIPFVRNIRYVTNFWDNEVPMEECGPFDDPTFVRNTLLQPVTARQECAADRLCNRLQRNAGLTARYR